MGLGGEVVLVWVGLPVLGQRDGFVVQVDDVLPVLAPLRPSPPCSTLASHGEPSPALASPPRFGGRFDAPLVV